jgi:hypothetical protein
VSGSFPKNRTITTEAMVTGRLVEPDDGSERTPPRSARTARPCQAWVVGQRNSYRRAFGAGLVTAMLSSCGMANPPASTNTGTPSDASAIGCHLPVQPYAPRLTFIGIRAIARTGIPFEKLAIGFKTERRRWCVVSFVRDERNNPFTESVYFLPKASNGDVLAVVGYLKRTGLFVHIGVLRPRIYPFANQ